MESKAVHMMKRRQSLGSKAKPLSNVVRCIVNHRKFCVRKQQDKSPKSPGFVEVDYLLNVFFAQTIVLVRVSNQQFQGTIPLMVFDSMGICMIRPFLAEFPYTLRGLVVIVCPNHNKHNLSTH